MKPQSMGEAGAQCDARNTPSWTIMAPDSTSGLNSRVCLSGLPMSSGAQQNTPRSYGSGPLESLIQYIFPSTKLIPPAL